VTSKPGLGSTFRVCFPRHTATAGQAPQKSPKPVHLRGHETILVVEDEPSHLRMVGLMLEKFGYQVLTASSPGEALLLAERHSGGIHLMLSDLVMPEMNGRDLAKELASLCPDTLCMFMSGYTGDTIAHHGVLDEGIPFLHKPFSQQDLATKIREVLDSGQMVQQ
jgi:two-component system cell cycle sensor histidine kinase/response regulator CckA